MAAFEYRFKMQGMHKVSAEIAGAVCQQLSESEEGLTPKRLVDVSRDKNAPLHDEFEWDDAVASEKYREHQAQTIIQHLIIVKTDSEKERKLKDVQIVLEKNIEDEKRESADRGFVSTGEYDSKYIPLNVALTNEIWRANLLDSARRDSRVFIAKYNRLEELADIIDDMNNFLGA